MDAKKVADVDLTRAPRIERKPEAALVVAPVLAPTPAPERFDRPTETDRTVLSARWALAVFAAGIGANLGIEIFAGAPDPNAVAPAGLELAAIEMLSLALLLTPLVAMLRTKAAAGIGLVGGLGVLGFQAECFVGGHTGFFASGFMGINVVMLGLVGVCAGALASARR